MIVSVVVEICKIENFQFFKLFSPQTSFCGHFIVLVLFHLIYHTRLTKNNQSFTCINNSGRLFDKKIAFFILVGVGVGFSPLQHFGKRKVHIFNMYLKDYVLYVLSFQLILYLYIFRHFRYSFKDDKDKLWENSKIGNLLPQGINMNPVLQKRSKIFQGTFFSSMGYICE